MNQFRGGFAHQTGGIGRAKQFHGGGVGIQDLGLAVHQNGLGGPFDHVAVAFFAFIERQLGKLVAGYVLHDAQCAEGAAFSVEGQFSLLPHPANAAIDQQPVFAIESTAFERSLPGQIDPRTVVGVQQRQVILVADAATGRDAEDLAALTRRRDSVGRNVCHPTADVGNRLGALKQVGVLLQQPGALGQVDAELLQFGQSPVVGPENKHQQRRRQRVSDDLMQGVDQR